MENNMEIPQKIKDRITMWSSDSVSGYLSEKKLKTLIWKDKHHSVHCGIIYERQDMVSVEVPINGWMDKEDVMCVYI